MDAVTLERPIIISRRDYRRLCDLALAASSRTPGARDFLLGELARASVVDDDLLPANVVTMGAEVEYRDLETGLERKVSLVYPGEQDVEAGRISVLTPIGAALIGLEEGESIVWLAPNGARRSLIVLKVTQP